MSAETIRTAVLHSLGQIAPEADLISLRGDVSLREQLDIDSMDFLNFLIALNKALGIDIPERDYRQLSTLDGCVDYLTAHYGA